MIRALLDLLRSDVSAPPTPYAWLAGQFGHAALSILCVMAALKHGLPLWAGAAATGAVWAAKEIRDYLVAPRDREGVRTVDALTDGAFYAIGLALIVTYEIGPAWAFDVSAVALAGGLFGGSALRRRFPPRVVSRSGRP